MKKIFPILIIALFFPLNSVVAYCLGSFCLDDGPSTKPTLPYSLEVEVQQSPFQYLWTRSFLNDFNRLVNSLNSRPMTHDTAIRLNGGNVPLNSYYNRAEPQHEQTRQRMQAANQQAYNTYSNAMQRAQVNTPSYPPAAPKQSDDSSGFSGSIYIADTGMPEESSGGGSSAPRNNDQLCRNAYGPGSVWDGSLNDTGGPVCGCAYGYDWSADGSYCAAQVSGGGCDADGNCWQR